MKEMKMLIDKTGISKKLSQLVLRNAKSNNSIDAVSIIESLWVSIWIGCFRFGHAAVVRVNEVLRQISGGKRVASATTFATLFKKFTPSMNHQVFTYLYSCFFQQIHFGNYTLDANTSVITSYGATRQQKGINPRGLFSNIQNTKPPLSLTR